MNAALLAEDDAVSRHFLCEALQALGWSCDAVADGEAALQQASARHYDVLVLDLGLPRLDGRTLLLRLRASAQAASRRTPALALTADTTPALRDALRAAGFEAVGHKPIDLSALAGLLRPFARDGRAATTWDDDRALRAAGGSADIVAALRELMRRELPRQRTTIREALQRGDRATADAELHRLRASCGFCGAAALDAVVERLQQAINAGEIPDAALHAAFEREVGWLLAADD